MGKRGVGRGKAQTINTDKLPIAFFKKDYVFTVKVTMDSIKC